MNETSIELRGVLLDNGTVVLDRVPSVAPGPVRVVLHTDEASAATPVWKTLETIWADQRAHGHVPRSKEEVDAEISAMRDEDEERMKALERASEESRRGSNADGQGER